MFAFKIQINCLQNKQIWISLLFKFATNGKNNLKTCRKKWVYSL